MFDILKNLCNLDATSGDEKSVRDFIISEIKDYCEYRVDNLGNIIAFKKGNNQGAKKLMLDAHMDEVGLIITSVTEDGFLKFKTVGGIDVSALMFRTVKIGGSVNGVVSGKPIHLIGGDERKKLPKAESLYIDIGAYSKEEAEEKVSVGDVGVFYSQPLDLDVDKLLARGIDDKAGVCVLISILQLDAEYDFYATFSVQEEVGLRGAKTAAYTVSPDAAVILEATTAADIYGVAPDSQVCKLGGGPAISFMDKSTMYNKKLFDFGDAIPVPHQVKQYVSGGNNAGAVHLTKSGVPTLTVSLPTRYIHSPSCVASYRDLGDMQRFSLALIEALAAGEVL